MNHLKKDFYLGCPNCVEPKTTLERGEHIFINVTASQFGAKCHVLLECSVCGATKDITEEVNQISMDHFNNLKEK